MSVSPVTCHLSHVLKKMPLKNGHRGGARWWRVVFHEAYPVEFLAGRSLSFLLILVTKAAGVEFLLSIQFKLKVSRLKWSGRAAFGAFGKPSCNYGIQPDQLKCVLSPGHPG